MRSASPHRATGSRCALASFVLLAAIGCVGPPPAPEAERLIADVTGSAEPILFLLDGDDGDATDASWPTADALTLQEATRRALQSDARVQTRLARVRAALADAEQVRLLPNPVLEVAYRLPAASSAPDEIDIGVSAEWVSMLSRPGRSRAADDRLRGAVADALDAALDVVIDVRTLYAMLQSFEELIPALEQRGELLAHLIAIAQAKLDSGEGIRLDVTSLRTQHAELELDLLELARRRNDARFELAHLTGQPSLAGSWTIERRPALAPLGLTDDRPWIDTALAKRPDIEALRWEVEALKEDAMLAGVAILDGAGGGISAEKADDWSIGPAISVPIPLFDFGSARRARAEATLVEARHRLLEARRNAVTEVKRAHANYVALQSTVQRVRDVLLPLQQQRRQEIETIYLGGQTDITALLIAEQDLRDTQVRLVELDEKATRAHAELERSVGGPVASATVGAAMRDEQPRGEP